MSINKKIQGIRVKRKCLKCQMPLVHLADSRILSYIKNMPEEIKTMPQIFSFEAHWICLCLPAKEHRLFPQRLLQSSSPVLPFKKK